MVADVTTLSALLGSSRRPDAEPGQLQLPDGAKEETEQPRGAPLGPPPRPSSKRSRRARPPAHAVLTTSCAAPDLPPTARLTLT